VGGGVGDVGGGGGSGGVCLVLQKVLHSKLVLPNSILLQSDEAIQYRSGYVQANIKIRQPAVNRNNPMSILLKILAIANSLLSLSWSPGDTLPDSTTIGIGGA
jgi:hypothetical protein